MGPKSRLLISHLLFSVSVCLAFSGKSAAPSSVDPCQDFARYACEEVQGVLPDETGRVHNRRHLTRGIRELGRSLRESFAREFETPFKKQFSEMLRMTLMGNPDLLSRMIAKSACDNIETLKEKNLEPGLCPELDAKSNYIVELSSSITFGSAYSGDVQETKQIVSLEDMEDIFSSPYLTNLVDTHRNRFQRQLVRADLKNRVEPLFEKTRAAVVDLLRKLPPSQDREKMIQKITSVRLEIDSCQLDILQPNAFAFTRHNIIRICYSFLFNSTSDFSLIKILAHEIAHSIGPCLSPATKEAWTPVTTCLMRPESGGAPDCKQSFQLEELFCDWLAIEIQAKLKETLPEFQGQTKEMLRVGLANTVPLCFTDPDLKVERDPLSSHPTLKDRLELVAAHPYLRERMGCGNPGRMVYCPVKHQDQNQMSNQSLDEPALPREGVR